MPGQIFRHLLITHFGHVKLLNTGSKFAPAPCKQPEAQHPSRETILDKLLQLDEQVRNERENELAHTIQLNQKLRFTAHQISRQHQSHFRVWLPFLSRLIQLLRQLGSSVLYATSRPFRQIYHLHLLTSSPEPGNEIHSEQLVSKGSTTNHISISLFLQFSQEIIDR